MIITPIDYETVKDVLVIRAISAKRHYGHWEYLYDDYVLLTRLDECLKEAFDKGAERITLHKIGPFREAFNSSIPNPMRGTSSLAKLLKISRLEEFS